MFCRLLKHEKYKEHFDQNIIWKSSHTIREYLKESKNLKYQSKTIALSIRKNLGEKTEKMLFTNKSEAGKSVKNVKVA